MNAVLKWGLIGVGVAGLTALVIGFLESALGIDFGLLTPLAGMFAGVFTAYIGLNLSGNRTTAVASGEDKAAALALSPPQGQALLIVFREGFVGSMAGMNLSVDGNEIAQLKSPQFTALALAPGQRTLRAGFGGLAGRQNNEAELAVSAAAGQVVAVRATLGMGAVKNTIRLEAVSESTTALRQKLSGMKMVQPTAATV